MKDSQEFILGREGEARVGQWLKEHGYWVVPTALISTGGAPALEGWLRKIVLPDSLVSHEGVSRWVEIKTKSRVTFNRKRQRWEHGIALRHWLAYREVAIRTGIPGSLAVLELDARRVLLGRFDDIAVGSAEYQGTKMSKGGMVFFDIRRFEWFDYDSLQSLPGGLAPKTVQPWERRPPPSTRQLPLDNL